MGGIWEFRNWVSRVRSFFFSLSFLFLSVEFLSRNFWVILIIGEILFCLVAKKINVQKLGLFIFVLYSLEDLQLFSYSI